MAVCIVMEYGLIDINIDTHRMTSNEISKDHEQIFQAMSSRPNAIDLLRRTIYKLFADAADICVEQTTS
jgi:hypothetical protein